MNHQIEQFYSFPHGFEQDISIRKYVKPIEINAFNNTSVFGVYNPLSNTSAIDICRIGNSKTNYLNVKFNNGGVGVIDIVTGSTPQLFFTGNGGSLTTSITGTLGVSSSLSCGSIGTSPCLMSAGASAGSTANLIYGSTASVITYVAFNLANTNGQNTTNNWASTIFGKSSFAIPASGSTMATNVLIHPLGTQVAGGGSTSDTVALYISGASSATVTGNNYSLWSAGGINRFDGSVFKLTGATTSKFANIGGKIKEFYTDAGNSTTTETDLYTYTTEASLLGNNGETIEGEFGGVFVSSATATRQIKLYFSGTAVFDTGALILSLSSAWTIYFSIIRVSATVIRYSVFLTTQGASSSAYTSVGELTGLTLSSTNILKITGQAAGAGAASNDIVAKLGTIFWDAVSV